MTKALVCFQISPLYVSSSSEVNSVSVSTGQHDVLHELVVLKRH